MLQLQTLFWYLFVGSYTNVNTPVQEGIHLYKFNIETGQANIVSSAIIENASYLALDTINSYVYAVSENGNNSSVQSFSFSSQTGDLDFVSRQPTNDDPCYITLDRMKDKIVVGNYTGGSVQVFSADSAASLKEDQSIFFYGNSLNKKRQDKPHVHCTVFSPENDYLFITDLGTDKIIRYDVDLYSKLPFLKESSKKIFDVPSGSGPRHLVFHPNGNFAYLITELAGNILTYKYDKGDLELSQSIQADSLHAEASADIHISPDGCFLYASNRLQGDGIVIFKIDKHSGLLTYVGKQPTGKHPRNFLISPDGRWLLVAARDENKIQVFARDAYSGLLSDTHQDIQVDLPVCLKIY